MLRITYISVKCYVLRISLLFLHISLLSVTHINYRCPLYFILFYLQFKDKTKKQKNKKTKTKTKTKQKNQKNQKLLLTFSRKKFILSIVELYSQQIKKLTYE